MATTIVNSEICEIDGKKMLYFREPNLMLSGIEETLAKVGAEKFFSSTDEAVKKARESLAEFFFTVALKKDTSRDWWLMQPQKDPPDFTLMTIKEDPITITLDAFELVEIPGRCQTFDEALGIVQSKLNKGYAGHYNLLIFVNNERSKEWINLLNERLENHHPFKTIWTVHLLWYKGKKDLFGPIVNRLRPYPVVHIDAVQNDGKLYQYQSIPTFMEKITSGEKTFISFKTEFVKELTKKLRMANLRTLQASNRKNGLI